MTASPISDLNPLLVAAGATVEAMSKGNESVEICSFNECITPHGVVFQRYFVLLKFKKYPRFQSFKIV